MDDPFAQYKLEAASLGLPEVEIARYCQDRHREDRLEARSTKREEDEQRFRIEVEKEKLRQEENEKIRAHELALKRLELSVEDTADNQTQPQTQNVQFHPGGKPKLPYLEDKDDVDGFIFRFEKHAEAMKWPRSEWQVYLASLLKGKALTVYHELSLVETLDYDKLKASLLERFQCSIEGFRNRFRSVGPQKDEPMVLFLNRTEHLLNRWLQLAKSDKDLVKMKDVFLQEQLLQSVSPHLRTFLREREFETAKEMMETAERYRLAHINDEMATKKISIWNANGSCEQQGNFQHQNAQSINRGKGQANFGYRNGTRFQRGGRGGRIKSEQNPQSQSTHKATSTVKEGVFLPSGSQKPTVICYKCQKPGHKANECQTKAVVGNVCVVVSRCSTCSQTYQFSKPCGHPVDEAGALLGCDDRKAGLVLTEGTLNGHKVEVMLDSGCTTVGVRREFVSNEQYTGDIRHCKLFSGQVFSFPVALVELNCPSFSGTVEACVIEDPIADVVLGNIPGVNFSVTRVDAAAAGTRAQASAVGKPFKRLITPDTAMLDVGPVEVSHMQATDSTLASCFDKCRNNVVSDDAFSRIEYAIDHGLLYRNYYRKSTKELYKQLLVPKSLRKAVLIASHDGILAGHMAAGSTQKRILPHFYWPGLQKDVKEYCRTCDTCQRTFPKGRILSQPLEPLPMVDIPFERVGIDLVGPFNPISGRGHRWILTLVDFATRFPDAVPLKSIETEHVAEALLSIFSRVGFPCEIISDQGSQFTSDLMKSVMRLLSIKQTHSTPYHAQTNGLVERFNGTLKAMLRKVAQEKPSDWDRYIPAALFAYRELPQSSTGFSPFELLFGRSPRGPSEILKDVWTGHTTDSEVKNSYQYVYDLRNTLADMTKLAQDSLATATARYKMVHDKKSKPRELSPGDDVLVFLPTSKNKLLLKWQGPYKVLKRVGLSDYVVLMKNREKLFHINMLRQYFHRNDDDSPSSEIAHPDVELSGVGVILGDSCGPDEDIDKVTVQMVAVSPSETFQDVVINPNLGEKERLSVLEICKTHAEVLTDLPGDTNLVEHSITMTVDSVVHVKPYPLPFQSESVIQEEVNRMLSMGVIEPSVSPFCSPIVLIKKKDGNTRFCIDFRALNRLTQFDAEPIPDVEEMFIKLKDKKYFTKIDLTKGYWQIRVSEKDRPKTAFQTSQGLFQFCRMPFGLVTAPMTFARMMRMLQLQENSGMSFFDDILVASMTWDDHLHAVDQVLSKLANHGLTVRPSKMEMGFQELEFLGHVVGGGVMKPVSTNVSKILNISVPRTKKQVRALVGLCSYYRRYVPNFADLVAPLVALTKKNVPAKVVWTQECQESFEKVKTILSSNPVIALPDFSKQFILRTDASNKGIGATLMQIGSDGELHPVLYASRKLLDREMRYSTIERECLALVWAVDKFSRYLIGREFVLQTDHRPLTYLQKSKTSNGRLMRWSLALQEYHFVLVPIAGSANLEADVLSRLYVD